MVADLVSRSRPLVKADVAKLRELSHLLNQPESRQTVISMLDRLPESMTDQTRTGTYGSWYNYYLCEFSGDIPLPELDGIPGHQGAHQGAQQPPLPQHRAEVQLMSLRSYSDAKILRLGAITLVVMLLVMAAAFNLSKFPGFGGSLYRAEFKDASGLHQRQHGPGRRHARGPGQADRARDRTRCWSTFEVDNGVEFGSESAASIEVLNLLGEKYLELTPAGSGQLDEDDVIPVERTQSAYDIVGVFGDLTTTTERIDTEQLRSGAQRRVRHARRRRPGHQGQHAGHLPALADRRLPRPGDPDPARELPERQQGARRPQRGHRDR